MVGSPARTDEESSRQQQANRIAIEEDGADSNNPPPEFATRDLLRPVGRAIVSIRVISTTTCEHNSLISCQRVLFFFFLLFCGVWGDRWRGAWWISGDFWWNPPGITALPPYLEAGSSDFKVQREDEVLPSCVLLDD